MKKKILQIIYSIFETWALQFPQRCTVGCATCCTQNVTVIALEGENILQHCIDNNLRTWLLDRLGTIGTINGPSQTTNEYILASLQNRETGQADSKKLGVCPFLEDNRCGIYPVRPFSCRCFISESVCQPGTPASISDVYLYGSMVTMQIIEHLGQFERWGHLSDILLHLLQSRKYGALGYPNGLPSTSPVQSLRMAQPLPGYIVPEENLHDVNILLGKIFSAKIGEKTVEQILNGQ